MIICSFCGENFGRDVNGFLKHKKKIHPMKKGEDFKCDDCGKTYKTYSSFASHRDYVHNLRKRSVVKCDHCEKTFTGNFKLNIHIKIMHNGRPFECDICHKKFKTKHAIDYHTKIKSCSGKNETSHNKEGRIACTYCEKKMTKSNMKEHIAVVHQGIRFHCDVCDQVFRSKGALCNHKKAKHPTNDTKIHKCEKCEYKTYTFALYKRHILRH